MKTKDVGFGCTVPEDDQRISYEVSNSTKKILVQYQFLMYVGFMDNIVWLSLRYRLLYYNLIVYIL